jgi:hypothetical protein
VARLVSARRLRQARCWLAPSVQVGRQVLLGELVAREDVEGVPVDLHVAADGHVRGADRLHVLVHVLVLSAVEELAWDDSGVLLGGLVDRDRVIAQVERDDESAVNILGHAGVEPAGEAEDVLVVVDGLEEVNLGLLGHEAVHLAEGVDLVSEAVIGRHLHANLLRNGRKLDLADWELVAVLGHVPVAGELIDALNDVDAAVGVNVALGGDLVGGQVVVADEVLAWLVHVETVWQLLSSQEKGEGVASVVRVVNLTDLNGIVSQVVVDNVGEVVVLAEEAEDLSVVVKELLLGGDLTATESLLKELLKVTVSLGGGLDLGLGEVVLGRALARGKVDSEVRLETENERS